MAVPDVFQVEITVVVKELVHVALREIAKVVQSCGDGEVPISTANDSSNSNITKHMPELRKSEMVVSDVLVKYVINLYV